MADIPRQNFCTLPVYSNLGQVVGKQMQMVNDGVRHMGIIPKHVDGHGSNTEQQQNQENQGEEQDITEKRGGHSPEHTFRGSSVCYGGPDKNYGCFKERKKPIEKNKIGVRTLEETADPYNLEYATRGDWWKGNVYNGKAGLSNWMDVAWNMISMSLSLEACK